MRGVSFVCSWSAGKDACLAFHRAVACGGEPRGLLCLAREDGLATLTHDVPVTLVRDQADRLGVPLDVCPTSWHDYEFVWSAALRRQREAGVEAAVFGDLHIARHRAWERRVCRALGLRAVHPLWKVPPGLLVDELFATRTRAVITCLRADQLDTSYLGRELTRGLLGELRHAGVDPFGEHGEYHTLVVDAALFSHPIEIEPAGAYFHDGQWHLDLGTRAPAPGSAARPPAGGVP